MSTSEVFNSWDLDINEDYRELYHSFFQSDYIIHKDKESLFYDSRFLDTTKKNFSLLEKFIYDIAMFHFRRLNIEYDENKHKIEIWISDRKHYDNNSLHVDCDESYRLKYNKFVSPLLSTVTYLNYDNKTNNPTMVTNIPHNSSSVLNKYTILQYNSFYFSFPKFLKHISFDGGNCYHGMLDYFNYAENKSDSLRQVLAIGLWDVETCDKFIYMDEYDKIEPMYLQTIPKDTSVVTLKKNNLTTKITVCGKEEKKSSDFFILDKLTLKSIIGNTFNYLLNINKIHYWMLLNNKELVYFIEKIKKKKKGDLYDNFEFHFI